MFNFTSFPSRRNNSDYLSFNQSRGWENDHGAGMDLDLEEGDLGNYDKVTTPGEFLTSTQAFMRCVFDILNSSLDRIVNLSHL